MKKLLLSLFAVLFSSVVFATGHVATATKTDVTCNGQCNGSANGFATGGIGPYGYSWAGPSSYSASSQNISNLCAGTYTLTVIDSADMSSAIHTVVINQPNPIVITTNTPLQACMGSCATIIANTAGGTSPYAYVWLPNSVTTAFNSVCPVLSSETYTVMVTDLNGCTSTSTAILIADAGPTINISAINTNCNNQCDGSIVNNTIGAVTYIWNGPAGFTSSMQNPVNLCVGSYTLAATNAAGCSSQGFVNVSSNNTLSGSVSVGANASCFGSCDGVLTAIPSGGTAPYTYLWSNGTTAATATNLCAGVYTVQITDANGCSVVLTGTINQPTQIAINPSSSPATCGMCDGAIMTNVTGGVPAYTYSWAPTLPSFPQHSNVCAGTYTVAVTDANGCLQTSVVTVSNSSGIVVTQNTTPSSACAGSCTGSATIIQSGGVAPYTYSLNGGAPQMSNIFTGLCSGSYVAAVTDNNGCIGYSTFFVGATSIPGLTVVPQITNESGAGLQNGSINITLNGTTAPYTFAWGNGAVSEDIYSLAGGSYTVVITDNNGDCSSYTFTVNTTPSYGYITGYIYNDANNNCLFDVGESPIVNYSVTVTNGTNTYTGLTNGNGYYVIWVPSGNYTVTPVNSTYLSGTCTTSYSVNVTNGSTQGNNNFAYNQPFVYDVCVSAWSSGVVPGFNGTYQIYLTNYTSLSTNGTVCIDLPVQVSYVSSIPGGATVTGNTVCFNYTNLGGFSSQTFLVSFYTPVGTTLGTPTAAIVTATVTSGVDVNPGCNTYTYTRPVTGSFDPNDKTVSPAGIGATGDIQLSETEFNYLIRFQNTGNGPAVNIVVDDTISGLLDLQSLEVLNASHAYEVELLPNNLLRFKFDNIMLPDSTSDEPGSHGHVQFRINKLNAATAGEEIENTAYIYFDFNEPVITNTAMNTYVIPTGIEEITNGEIAVYPNPFSDVTTFVIHSDKTNGAYTFELFDVLGKKVMDQTNITAKQFQISRNGLESGVYFYKIYSSEMPVKTGKLIIK
ncbi:MAG: T9SS type A sorting domain-containing protein [Bacteroidia bacterium]|nr:T9SS type A sorting domain-containing protein [Bacteroidia bacterium]